MLEKIGIFVSKNAKAIRISLIIALGISLFAFVDAYIDQRVRMLQYQSEVIEYKKNLERVNIIVDSLENEVQFQEVKAEEAQKLVDILQGDVVRLKESTTDLKTRLDTLKAREVIVEDTTVAEIIEIQDSIIEEQDSVIEIQAMQIDELDTIIRRKDLSIMFLTESVDSLQNVISLYPEFPDESNKLFGFIPKPSRTTVAISSYFLGALTILLITK